MLVLQTLYQFSPIKTLISLFLMLMQAATAGIGLMLIMPMVGLLGANDPNSSLAGESQVFSFVFDYFSLPLSLISLLVVNVVLLSVVASIQYMLTIRISETQQKIVCHYRNRLYRALVRSNWGFILRNEMSDFKQSLIQQVQSLGSASQLFLTLIGQIISILIYMTLVFLISWKIGLSACLLALTLFGLSLPLSRRVYNASQDKLLRFKDYFYHIEEHLDNLKMIKSYSAENKSIVEVRTAGDNLEKQIVQVTKIQASSKFIYMISSAFFVSTLILVSVNVFEVAFSALITILAIFSRILPNFTSLFSSYNRLVSEMPAVVTVRNKIRECETQPELHKTESAVENAKIIFKEKLEFLNISYKYPEQTQATISDLSFELRANEITAFSGISGSGKTTAADLLMGLLKPQQGKIKIDNIELTSKNMLAWRRSIAYVTQEPHFFHSSIRHNLTWFGDSNTDEEIYEVLKLASVKGFVDQLPEGLDTKVGEKGLKISGGERQRLAIARALLRKPRLLVFDEATSALDKNNENNIKQVLLQLKRNVSIILISHSQSTLDMADEIVRF